MASPEHVAKLSEGVEKWNQWRTANLETTPNLSGANLEGANLEGAKLPSR